MIKLLAVVKSLAMGLMVLGFTVLASAEDTRVVKTMPVTEPQIVIHEFQFSQPTLTVAVGATVTWVNRDEESHTVTSASGLFTSPALDRQEAFSYRFTAPGTYAYYCALHPHMTARVIVR